MHSRRLLIALALVTLSAAPAQAQLGGLMKKAAKAAAAKVGEKAEEKAGLSSDSQEQEAPKSEMDSLYAIVHPTSADVKTLDAALLDKFFTGYAVEGARTRKIAACEARVYETPQWKKWDADESADAQAVERIGKARRAYVLKECGIDIEERDAAEMKGMLAGAQEAGLPPRTYAMVRERVIAYAAMAAKYNVSNYRGYKFGGAEKAALDARRADADRLLSDYRGS